MTNAQTFIVLQTLWDLFLIVLACGVTCYWFTFWLLVLNDEPLEPRADDLFTRLVLRCRELRSSKEK